MKKIMHVIEIIPLVIIILVSRIIGIDRSSNLGAFLARLLGPFHKSSKIAAKNIKHVFPDLSDKEVKELILKIWEDAGRTFFEMPHIYKLSKQEFYNRVQVIGKEKLKKVDLKKSAIWLTGHFSNWEVAARAALDYSSNPAILYRKINNRLLDQIVLSLRSKKILHIPKGLRSVRQLLQAIKEKRFLCFLTDQKLREGIETDFFNKKAHTATVPLKLAIKSDLPIIFGRVVRTKGANFKFFIYEPFYAKDIAGKNKELVLAKKMNKIFEEWIKEEPAQWFTWLHRRWEKEFYR
jgi:Kdo2-lipid IVA lauroyltransferase/acyltransferase